MKKIKGFISKYWLFIILAALATILAALYLSKKGVKVEEIKNLLLLPTPEIKSQNSPLPDLKQLENNFPQLNKEIVVYQVENISFSDQQAINLAEEFGFQEKPRVTRDEINGAIYRWSNDKSNLSIYLRDGKINYGLDLLRNPELIQGEAPSLEKAEVNFRSFLKRVGLFNSENINLELKKNNYIKLNKGYFQETTNDDPQKSLAYLEFIYKINNYEIQGINPIAIRVYLDSQLNIINLDFQKIFGKVENLDLYPLKNKEEILQILKNQPQLSFLRDSNSELEEEILLEYALKEIKELSFNKIELIYYKSDSPQSYLQPVYSITGDAYLEDIGWVQAGLYLPAIKDEYLLK